MYTYEYIYIYMYNMYMYIFIYIYIIHDYELPGGRSQMLTALHPAWGWLILRLYLP